MAFRALLLEMHGDGGCSQPPHTICDFYTNSGSEDRPISVICSDDVTMVASSHFCRRARGAAADPAAHAKLGGSRLRLHGGGNPQPCDCLFPNPGGPVADRNMNHSWSSKHNRSIPQPACG